ncbi:hypothetical protein EsH8_III_000258 [Colletotrichum jinshuiense]
MYSSPEEIEAAVEAYRSHISHHNRRIVEVYVSLLADAEPEEGDFEGDQDVNELRLEALDPIFDTRLGEFVSTPGEILTRWDELCSVYDLDGTAGRPSEEDAALCEEYFSHMEKALRGSCLEEVRGSISFPEEFRVLAKHVNCLTGPGLTEHKSRYQACFWLGPHAPPYMEEYIAKRVKTPEWLDGNMDGGWEYAAGWQTGGGCEDYFYIVYCRRAARPDNGSPEPWAWRYVSNDAMDFGVFDTIPELLAWYSGYRESKVPDASSMTGYDILMGDVI